MRAAIPLACLASMLPFAALAAAARAQPFGKFLIYRQAGVLHLLSEDGPGAAVQVRGQGPSWEWEGHGSYAVLRESPQGLTVEWYLDVAGTPDWERVTLAQCCDGVRVCVRHQDLRDDSAGYGSFEEMLDAGDGAGEMIALLLGRLGHGTRVPELSTVRALVFGRPDPCGRGLRRECLGLIALLDSEDFRTRERASRELARAPRVEQLKRLTGGTNLSPEQACRVAVILAAHALPQDAGGLLPQLRALAFGETDAELAGGKEAAPDDE